MSKAQKFENFGRYILLHRIAVGGMAEIFLALDPVARNDIRLLVVKRIRQELSDNKEFIEMFHDEERVISQLSHPNIIKLLDFGEVAGRYFIALEHVWGESLATLTQMCANKRTPFPLFAALFIATKVANALEHAHNHIGAQGEHSPVIHRDVTLGNVVASYRGEVKVLDFGIAKAKDRLAHTRAGQIKGTLVYLAPEQLLGEPVGAYTDIYQLGVMIYQTLVGRAPVEAKGEIALMKAIVAGKFLKPSDIAPDFPKPVEQLILKAMARKPEHRFSSAGELAGTLMELMGTAPVDSQQRLAHIVSQITEGRKAMQEAFIRDLLQGIEVDREASDLFMWATAGESGQTVTDGLPALGSTDASGEAELDLTDPTMVIPPAFQEELESDPLELSLSSDSISALLPDLDFPSGGSSEDGASGVFVTVDGRTATLAEAEVEPETFEPQPDDLGLDENIGAEVFQPQVSPVSPVTLPDIERPAGLTDVPERDADTQASPYPERKPRSPAPDPSRQSPAPVSGVFKDLLAGSPDIAAPADRTPALDGVPRKGRRVSAFEPTKVVREARENEPPSATAAEDDSPTGPELPRLEIIDPSGKDPTLEVLKPEIQKPRLEVLGTGAESEARVPSAIEVGPGSEGSYDFPPVAPPLPPDAVNPPFDDDSGEYGVSMHEELSEPEIDVHAGREPVPITDEVTDIQALERERARRQAAQSVKPPGDLEQELFGGMDVGEDAPSEPSRFDISQAMTHIEDARELSRAAAALDPGFQETSDPDRNIFATPTLLDEAWPDEPAAGPSDDTLGEMFRERRSSGLGVIIAAVMGVFGAVAVLYFFFGRGVQAPPINAQTLSDAGVAEAGGAVRAAGATGDSGTALARAGVEREATDTGVDSGVKRPDAARKKAAEPKRPGREAEPDKADEADSPSKTRDRRRVAHRSTRASDAPEPGAEEDEDSPPPPPPPPPPEERVMGELTIDPGPGSSIIFMGESARGRRKLKLEHDRGKMEVRATRPKVDVTIFFHVLEDGVKLRIDSEPKTSVSLNGIDIGPVPKSLLVGRRYRIDLASEDLSKPLTLLVFYKPVRD